MVSYPPLSRTSSVKSKVSVPSRGLGSFLRKTKNGKRKYFDCFRPLSRYGWGPTFELYSREDGDDPMFPAPLEAWVVSYTGHMISYYGIKAFPAPLEGWVVSYVSFGGLSWGWFGMFPSPLEAWVVSYPISCIPKGFNTQDSSYLETILSIPYFTRAFS